MAAAQHIARTSFRTLYARRIPALGVWATGLIGFLGWPHVAAYISNRNHNVPHINASYL